MPRGREQVYCLKLARPVSFSAGRAIVGLNKSGLQVPSTKLIPPGYEPP